MGMYSWECLGCHTSLRHHWPGDDPALEWRQHVVLISATGVRVEGAYDGYGRVQQADGKLFKVPHHWDDPDAVAAENLAVQAASQAELASRLLATLPSDSPPKAVRRIRAGVTIARKVAAETQQLAHEARAVSVAFSAWHRRCWEAAERPPFTVQSPRAADQGA